MLAYRFFGRCWAIALLSVLIWSATAFAEVPIPSLEHRVTDLTATLSPEQQAVLEAQLADFERQKGSQVAVLIVPSTQPEDIAQYSIRVVEQWQLGRKGVDDGVLMLIAKNDRAARIEVGYGLEGVIPDAVAKRIVEDFMIPYFRTGNFAGGIDAGVERLISLIQGEALPEKKSASSVGGLSEYFPLLAFLAVIGGGVLRAVLGKFLGGLINGGIVGLAIWLLGGGLFFALVFALMAFVISLGDHSGYRGGMGGGFGGSFGGGGFSGGGGGFGGGGASGRW